MKIKPMKQPDNFACGPICIFLASKYLENKTSFKEIAKISDYKKQKGMNDVDIVSTCIKIGLKAEHRINSTWNDLKNKNDKNSVLIVSWMQDGYKGHVSIVDKVSKDHIFLIDSDKGNIIKLGKVQFMRLWMEYDGLWWPEKADDIHLRSLIVVKK